MRYINLRFTYLFVYLQYYGSEMYCNENLYSPLMVDIKIHSKSRNLTTI